MLNLATAYQKYVNKNIHKKQTISSLNTALIRYTLPGFGFVIPQRSAKRFHPFDIQLALEYAKQFFIDENTGIKLLETQNKILNKTQLSLPNKRQQKKNLNKFINFIQTITKQNIKNKKSYEITKKIVLDCSHIETSKYKRQKKSCITLSWDPKTYKGNPKFIQKQLVRIKSEINSFRDFLFFTQIRNPTINFYIKSTERLLGWLYLENQSLKDVKLDNLVPVCNIYPEINSKNFSSYLLLKDKKEREAKNISDNLINFLEKFFNKYEISGSTNKSHYVTTLISLAKYLYANISNKNEYQNYEDIPVIRRLRVYRTKIPKNTKKLEVPLPSWKVVINCLKELKRRADLTNSFNGNRKTKLMRAKHLQNFLIFGMFTLVPPPRQRVVRELKIGETFKHGNYVNNIFVSRNKLDNPKEAKYYIHLQPENYKTGEKYGEWLAEFPDYKFEDGTNFYQYLDRWLYEDFRKELLKKESHNYLFLKENMSTPLRDVCMGHKISNLFLSTIKQEVSPQKLRTIYRTYLEDIGASQHVLNSSAFWMRHSPEIAKEVYTKQSLDNKLNPGKEMIININIELLKN